MEKIKQKIKNLKKLPGSLLYYNEGEGTFADVFDNCLFINEDESISSLDYNFDAFVLDFLSICAQVEDKPAIIYFDSRNINMHKEIRNRLGFGDDYLYFFTKNNQDGDESERLFLKNIKYHIDSNKPAFLTASREDHEELLIDIFHNRSVISPFFKQKIFIIIPNIEDFNIKHLTDYLTLCKSRRIYFIMLIGDVAKFYERYSKEEFDIICSLSKIIFKTDKTKRCTALLNQPCSSASFEVGENKPNKLD